MTCVSCTVAREIGKHTKNHGDNMIRKTSPEARRRTQRPQMCRHRKMYGSDTEDSLTRCAGFHVNDLDVPERKVGRSAGRQQRAGQNNSCPRVAYDMNGVAEYISVSDALGISASSAPRAHREQREAASKLDELATHGRICADITSAEK